MFEPSTVGGGCAAAAGKTFGAGRCGFPIDAPCHVLASCPASIGDLPCILTLGHPPDRTEDVHGELAGARGFVPVATYVHETATGVRFETTVIDPEQTDASR